MDAPSVLLLDEYGQPLSARLQGALLPLASRLRREFPALNDDCIVTEVLEEAGRRIAAREERTGPLDNLRGYAWVVARRMALLRVRCGEWVIASATLTGTASDVALRNLRSGFATSEQIFNELLYKELRADMTAFEKLLVKGKHAGLSDDDIARGCGTSRRTIANAWRRLRRKMWSRVQGLSGPRRVDWKRSRSV